VNLKKIHYVITVKSGLIKTDGEDEALKGNLKETKENGIF